MRVLTVPNWSFGNDPELLDRFRSIIAGQPVQLHYLASDPDHNRTVSAFSGESADVTRTLMGLAEVAFARIDMCRHIGVHPFIGALDVCPFVFPPGSEDDGFVVDFAAKLAHQYEIPVFLYEKSERGRHTNLLPEIRRGGFDRLIDEELDPDFGPGRANARLGASVVGERDFLIAMNIDLATDDLPRAKAIAREIRQRRDAGESAFRGIRALGFPLPSRGIAQVSLNLTKPDETTPDEIVAFVEKHVEIAGTELIGVIRKRDLAGAQRLAVAASQVVW